MIYSIQYLRAVAATLVVLFHSETANFNAGQAGVDIFFVISGFIMWETTSRAPLAPYEFMRRRLVRIVPLYWLVSLLMFAMPSLSGTIAGGTRQHFDHLLASMLFVPYPYPANPAELLPVYVPGWTINYEIFFYILFAASLFIPRSVPRLATLILLLAGLVIVGLTTRPEKILGYYTDPILLEFMAGALIGAWYTSKYSLPTPIAAVVLITGAILIFLDPANGFPRILVWGIPAALLVIGALSIEKRGFIAKLPALTFLGNASYALYLTHLFAIGAVTILITRFMPTLLGNKPVFASLAVALSLITAAFVHLAIEKPLNVAASRIGRKSSAHPPRNAQESAVVGDLTDAAKEDDQALANSSPPTPPINPRLSPASR
jgi:exopolysaccharide production protein ExoZ